MVSVCGREQGEGWIATSATRAAGRSERDAAVVLSLERVGSCRANGDGERAAVEVHELRV